MTNIIYRIQLYMYSVLTAMWIFQYEPLMLVKNVGTSVSLQVLTLVQLIVIGSLFLYGKLLKQGKWRNFVICCTLVVRIVLSLLLFIVNEPTIFVMAFMIYQIGAVGCDIFYESSVLEEVNRKGLDFGKFRMFGSLGYATSGFIVSGILLLGFDISALMILSAGINLILLFLQLKAPFSKTRNLQNISRSKVKIPFQATLLILACALITTLPGSFGYLFNGYLREQFSLPLQQVTLYVSIAVFLGSCVSEVSAFYVVDAWIRKVGAQRILIVGFLASILRWALALMSPNALTFIATYLLHGVNFAFLYVGVLTILKSHLSEKIMGTLTMRYMFIANLAGVVLAQLYASTIDYIGVRGILMSYLFISIFAFGFVVIFYNKLTTKSKESEVHQ
ncbi:MFS transporter [Lactococcus garvieae]|uniref:MFS transporter n=1 Tax=Lactococcus garvieae TaxID=1363 RepID=UPI0018D710CA|nr:MFS transporter [Lactococcus garvieae]QPS70467.1 MFS transporter [Lactococcus garvieae]